MSPDPLFAAGVDDSAGATEGVVGSAPVDSPTVATGAVDDDPSSSPHDVQTTTPIATQTATRRALRDRPFIEQTSRFNEHGPPAIGRQHAERM
jgi:hypothetical protein